MDRITQEKLLDIVKRNYEEIAEDFNETRNKALWPELVKLSSDVKDSESVLDVGCGNGRLSKAFIGKDIKYIGVDNSQKLIEVARRNWKLEVGSWKFIVGDILELNKVVQEKFDWVFCLAVLHHLPSIVLRVQALKQLGERLKPDGKIILTVWNLWTQVKFHRLIWKYTLLKIIGINKLDMGDILFPWKNNRGEKISGRYYHAFTMYGLKGLAKQAGLNIEKIYKDRYNYYLILNK